MTDKEEAWRKVLNARSSDSSEFKSNSDFGRFSMNALVWQWFSLEILKKPDMHSINRVRG